MLTSVFERFTDRARRVLVLAQEEARLLGHGFIGTEHILLGLIHEGEGVAAKALELLGVSLTAVREKVEDTIGGAAEIDPGGSMPFTPRAKKALELSLREALQLGHRYIGTEHMLLGLVREGEGVAAHVLESLGADLGRVRQQVIRLMSGSQEAVGAGAVSLGTGKGGPRSGWRVVRAGRNLPVGVAESCLLCGRDLWEVNHYIEGDEGRVCDHCVRAAATVLDAAGGYALRVLPMPPRVFGEVPDRGAVGGLVDAVDAIVGPAASRHRRSGVLEDAEALEPRLRMLDDRLAGGSRLSRVRFLAPDRAELRFHFRVVGVDGDITVRGEALRIDGRWVLSRLAVVDALERAGVGTPPAGE